MIKAMWLISLGLGQLFIVVHSLKTYYEQVTAYVAWDYAVFIVFIV